MWQYAAAATVAIVASLASVFDVDVIDSGGFLAKAHAVRHGHIDASSNCDHIAGRARARDARARLSDH
jgi:hypothetical protein